MELTITEFPVTIFGKLEPFSETISKTRVRIFYKGENRNGSYITDEFAEKLLKSIPYSPIKGIYSNDEQDYEGHGAERTEGRIYGVVAAEPNVTWEPHLDPDGVERTYACVDGLIYTALYEEAKQIVGKSQSMEIYRPSIKGDWKEINGKNYFVYTEGCFLGLQVLGDKKEPCFEGAGFFSLFETLQNIKDQVDDANLSNALNEISKQVQEYEKNKAQQEGGNQMPQFDIFKLSDSDKERKLFDLLNPLTHDGMDREWNCSIVQVYDKYAVIRTYGRGECEGKFERVFYTKNDETDTIEITGRETCYMMDVSEQEKRILDSLYEKNEHTFENLDQKFEASANNLEELNTKIVEYENQNSTLTIENERLNGEVTSLTEKFNTVSNTLSEKEIAFSHEKEEMQKKINELDEFKLGVVRQSKKNILNGYEGLLSNEVIESFEAKLDNYDEEQLDMLLTYEVKKQNPDAFGKTANILIPKEQPLTGLEAVLSKYRDRK